MITSLILALATLSPAHASASAGTWTYDKDGSAWEIYADAVEKYNGTNPDLALCIDGVDQYVYYMGYKGYSIYREYTDNAAWPTDFEEAHGDDIYNDVGDFNYFSGHGNTGSFYFGYNPGSSDLVVTASETWWGENDAEVVALDSCLSLDSTGRSAFGSANLNSGLHYIMGFATVANDTAATAAYYGYYLYAGYGVRDAWHYAADAGHDATHTAAYVRFYNYTCDTYSDDAVTVSCDPTSGSSYSYATWTL